jgi:hypothetical protein
LPKKKLLIKTLHKSQSTLPPQPSAITIINHIALPGKQRENKMNKIIIYILLLIAALICWGCQKTEEPKVVMQQYVVFSISQVDPLFLKNGDEVICPLDDAGNIKSPTIAEVIVNGVTYHPEVYLLNGKLYTQSIKLALPDGSEFSYNISGFALLESIGGDIIMATPAKGSFYAEYVSAGVDFDISVTPFGKTEVPVEVLCFLPDLAELFGFNNKPDTRLNPVNSSPDITLKIFSLTNKNQTMKKCKQLCTWRL